MSTGLIIIAGLVILVLLWRATWYRQQVETLRKDIRDLTEDHHTLASTCDNLMILRDAFIEAVDDAILVLDKQSLIQFANGAAVNLFTRALENQTLMVATRNSELDHLVKSARENLREVQERRFAINDHVVQARVLGIEQNTIILLHDVTIMQRLSRARREMIANITHELNTPITTIGLLADTLVGGAGEKADIRQKMLTDIRAETATLTQLVQEMRDLSLIESRQMPIKMLELSLKGLVETTILPLQALAEQKNQQIKLDIPATIEVFADENQLPRALKNIVHNAIKFTPEGGVISISTSFENDFVTLQVKDNGVGLNPGELERIFERFYQSDPSRQHGTGLGLAIARHIILGHGGQIWAKNNSGEPGMSFFFTLPHAMPEEAL